MGANQQHKNRIEARLSKRLSKEVDEAKRTLRRYGANGKSYTGAYTAALGHVVLTGPKGMTIAMPVSKNVDMRHEARLRAFHERKARGTKSSATRKIIK